MVEDSSVLIGLGVFMDWMGRWWLEMFWFDWFSDSLDFLMVEFDATQDSTNIYLSHFA
jgi:hypothetical protein